MSSEKPKQNEKEATARKLTADCPQRASLAWEGREIPMVLERGTWRARKRSKALTVDIGTGTGDLAMAKRMIRDELLRAKSAPELRAKGTLAELVEIYRKAPKRASPAVAEANVERLKAIVKTTWKKTLDDVKLAELPRLWPAYVATRQKKAEPDYNTRLAENAGINSAMRLARSILIEQLRPAYRAAGIILPDDADNVIWTAELASVRKPAKDDDMIKAWRALPVGSSLWWTIGLARFAGLRRSEILAMRGKWAVDRGGLVFVELQDRPEDKWWSKTGRPYSAMVMDAALADALRLAKPEQMLIAEPDAEAWIEKAPQKWLRDYVGAARLPLHRLRGLYADHVRRETEQAILARQKASKTASKALGHASVTTTERHYFSNEQEG